MPPPTREQVNALIETLKNPPSGIRENAAAMLTALQAENDRLRAQASPAWVALSERKPTINDASDCGHVLWLSKSGSMFGDAWHSDYEMRTHWMRLPAPPESAAEQQARADEEALHVEWTRHAVGGDSGRFANFCNGFRAALAHARKEATP